jgi:glutamyl-tRNA reductase
VTPTILALRERVRGVLEGEFERSLAGKLRHLSREDRQALALMSEATVNKLLHDATQRLRKMAADPGARPDLDVAVGVLTDLFDLEALSEKMLGSSDPAVLAAAEAINLGSDPPAAADPSGPSDTIERDSKPSGVARAGSGR